MPDLFWQGVSVSVIGITLTFLALGLLILAMVVLERVFRSTPSEVLAPATALDSAAGQGDAPAEEVAAIAVALAVVQSSSGRGDGLGAALGEDRSPWWSARVRAQRRSDRISRTPKSAS